MHAFYCSKDNIFIKNTVHESIKNNKDECKLIQ